MMRALCRAEAELLIEERRAMSEGRYRPRSPEQRRTDAAILVIRQLVTAGKRVVRQVSVDYLT
jgi:hypothetical protein